LSDGCQNGASHQPVHLSQCEWQSIFISTWALLILLPGSSLRGHEPRLQFLGPLAGVLATKRLVAESRHLRLAISNCRASYGFAVYFEKSLLKRHLATTSKCNRIILLTVLTRQLKARKAERNRVQICANPMPILRMQLQLAQSGVHKATLEDMLSGRPYKPGNTLRLSS